MRGKGLLVALMLVVGVVVSPGGAALELGSVTDDLLADHALEGVTVTSVQPGTRVLLANGEPFLVKGYNHWPNALGEGTAIADPYFDTSQCTRDGRLLRGAGATTVRIWLNFGRALGIAPQIRECADLFAAEGIGVAWTIGQPGGVPTDPGFKEQFELYIDVAVAALADSPGTMFWLIGNEIELLPLDAERQCSDNLSCVRAWFGTPGGDPGMLDELSARVKALDPAHLVGTSVSGRGCFMHDIGYNVPSLDVWGLNTYPGGGSPLSALCGGGFFDTINADPRPKFITEFGTDRFRCVPALTTSDDKRSYYNTCEPEGSGEDQAGQAAWLANIWDSMGPLATPANPMGALSGGQAFFFADIWEHCMPWLSCVGTPTTHEVSAWQHPGAPDGSLSVEWWGIVPAQLRGEITPRATTLGFDALARRWSDILPPTITSGPSIDLSGGGCAPALVWTTDEPGSSEVQFGVDGRKLDVDGMLVSDDTILTQMAHLQGSVTQHRVPLRNVVAGLTYRLIPRTFTSDGRSVTSGPLLYELPLDCLL